METKNHELELRKGLHLVKKPPADEQEHCATQLHSKAFGPFTMELIERFASHYAEGRDPEDEIIAVWASTLWGDIRLDFRPDGDKLN